MMFTGLAQSLAPRIYEGRVLSVSEAGGSKNKAVTKLPQSKIKDFFASLL
jgi:hypothetical protein